MTLEELRNQTPNREIEDSILNNIALQDIMWPYVEKISEFYEANKGIYQEGEYPAVENSVDNAMVKKLHNAMEDTIKLVRYRIEKMYYTTPEKLYDGFFLQEISREVYRQKYALHDSDGTLLESNVFETIIRVALAVAGPEVRLDGLSKADASWAVLKAFAEFFTLIALKQFSGGGRIMANAGASQYKTNTTLINCTVMEQIPDSIEGIMDVAKQAALSLKSGAGVGYNFSTIRPKGAFVYGAGAETSGVLSFMDIFDRTCNTIMSAGGRRGAQMATLHVEHPEVRQFITSKREDGKLRYFNLSLLITDRFMEAVQADSSFDLWFWEKTDDVSNDYVTILPGDIPYSHPNATYFRFHEDHVESKYGNSQNKLFKKKVYETVDARHIYDLIMESNYDFAEPGFILIDEVNRKNNLNPYGEFIQATNPCVTGDTLVATELGLLPIERLVDQEIVTLVDDRPNEGSFGTSTALATGVYSGEKPVLEIVTERGYRLKLTEDHKVFTRANVYVEAQNLKVGEQVSLQSGMNALRPKGEEDEAADGFVLGCVMHNGAVITDYNEDGSERISYQAKFALPEQPAFTIMHDRLLKMFDEEVEFTLDTDKESMTNIITYTDARVVEWFQSHGLVSLNQIPDSVMNGSRALVSGFIQGMFSTIGDLFSVDVPKKLLKKKGSVFANENVARSMHLLLLDSGVVSTLETVNTHFLIYSEKGEKVLNYYTFNDKIKSITPVGTEKVYDLQVPGMNTFIGNGLVIHNCGEQPLPTNGSCDLGSLFLPTFVDKAFTAKANIDLATYRYAIRAASRFLDNVNDVTSLPLESLRKEAWYKRRHGLGVTGVSDFLSALGIRYGSNTYAEATLDTVFRELAVQSLIAGVDLAEEKESAPIFLRHGTTKLRSSQYIQNILYNVEDKADARHIIDGIENGYMRYSHATSIAPTGTMSLTWADNAANGVEPTYSHSYQRNIRTTGKLAKVQQRVFSLALLWWLNAHDKEYTEGMELPRHLGTTDDLSVDDHLSVQAIAQKYVDSAVSKTCNVPTDISFESFKDTYIKAWKSGLKGFTTFRFNPNFSVGVLTKDSDLKNTTYEFEIDHGNGMGETVRYGGEEMVTYKGETMNVANLYEALKENMFGKM